jgi:hypothetical protein
MVLELQTVLTALGKAATSLISSAKPQLAVRLRFWFQREQLESIAHSLQALSLVKTIGSTEAMPFESFYFAPKVFVGRSPVENISSLKDLTPSGGNLLLTGTVGQGKSIFLRYLASAELKSGDRIPLYVGLQGIDLKLNVEGLLIQKIEQLGMKGVDHVMLDYLLASGHVVVFLDGFDEVALDSVYTTQAKLRSLMAQYAKTQFVISTRPGQRVNFLSGLPKCYSAKLASLEDSDFYPFFRALGSSEDEADHLIKGISSSSAQIKGVLKTPLLLALVKLTFGSRGVVPPMLHNFYEEMFSVMAARHDAAKPFVRNMVTGLGVDELEDVFAAFCFLSKDYGSELTERQFQKCAKGAATLFGKTITSEGLKSDLLETVCLMTQEGLKYPFLHHTVQQFFAASFVRSLEDIRAKTVYIDIRNDKHFEFSQELKFLEHIDRSRYITCYRLPAIDKFLITMCGESKRSKPTKKRFDDFIQRCKGLFVLRTKSGNTYSLILRNSASIDSVSFDFLMSLAPNKTVLLTGNISELPDIKLSSDMEATPQSAAYKRDPQLRDQHFLKLGEYIRKIGDERSRLEREEAQRKSSFDKILDQGQNRKRRVSHSLR